MDAAREREREREREKEKEKEEEEEEERERETGLVELAAPARLGFSSVEFSRLGWPRASERAGRLAE